MMTTLRTTTMLALALTAGCVLGPAGTAVAPSAAEIDQRAKSSLAELYGHTPAAQTLGADAKGILVFPSVGKAGFIFAGGYGAGALNKGGRTAGYYNFAEVSYGFQAGIEKFAFAMFFMTDKALNYFEKSAGYEIGMGPTITVVDAGIAKKITTTTGRDDVYAFIYGNKGLMGGLGLRGSKITPINPK